MGVVNYNAELTLLEKIKWSRNVLEIMQPKLVMQQLADEPDMLREGEGLTCRFTRILPHGKTSSDMTDLNHGDTDSVEVNIPGFTQFDVTPTEYGNHQTFWLPDTRQGFISYVNAAKKAYGQWYGEGVDYLLTKMVSQACFLTRADGDTSYTVDGTTDDTGTTTTLIDTTNLTQADDYWNGGIVVITSGNNIGEARIVSDFANGTSTVTVSVAFPNAVASGVTYHICTTTGLDTGDVLTTQNVRKAVRTLEDNKAPKIGSHYVGVLDAYQKFDFIESLTSVSQYTEKGIQKVFANEVGEALGVRWVFANKIYRADAALYAENTSGNIRVSLIMGANAFGNVKVNNDNLPKLTLQSPLGGSTDPHKKKGQLGVSVTTAHTMLNSLNVVGIACRPTA